ncbi:leucyl/phenylalanyl-tRNA--protein transferase [Taibaiella koreensis]|uniref:leucyl/phenylalanyl-tRNA--protein transferase n=1 Tax=Taibaiella koreensis TaxID=1268548 RepID=UPI000E59A544|nr:leucyl/phenylalanyl-tRNA--protein transferase [Taibaiella koreensis]
MIFRLSDEDLWFPDPALAEEDGLLAVGGDLSGARLRLAYAQGIFPWFSKGDPVLWYAPHERCVLFPGSIHMSKSMQQVLRQGRFHITRDTAFGQVIRSCATILRKGLEGTWITGAMQQAYLNLHLEGIAHSVEVWNGPELVGGLYGVAVNKVFCGESMFSRTSNASKAALIWLCRHGGYQLIDCQLPNPHLMSLGAEMIPREKYLSILQG